MYARRKLDSRNETGMIKVLKLQMHFIYMLKCVILQVGNIFQVFLKVSHDEQLLQILLFNIGED